MINQIDDLNEYLYTINTVTCVVKFSNKLDQEFQQIAENYPKIMFIGVTNPIIIEHEKITLFPDLLCYHKGAKVNVIYSGNLINTITKFNEKINTNDNIHYLTDLADYQELIKGNAIVKFTASWCQPCKITIPTFHDLANRYSHKIVFIEVDVDLGDKISVFEKIKSMPTFKFYLFGELTDSFVGCNLEILLLKTEALIKTINNITTDDFSDVEDEIVEQSVIVDFTNISEDDYIEEDFGEGLD